MNAGDELRLRFPAQPAPADGWRRDFVLIGDGWEKDGDYNTGHSQTVLPLPAHARPDYGAGPAAATLEDDAVYQTPPERLGTVPHALRDGRPASCAASGPEEALARPRLWKTCGPEPGDWS